MNDVLADEQAQLDAEEEARRANAATIDERAANGEEIDGPDPPIAFGGAQLSLNMGAVLSNRNARQVEEARIAIQGGEQLIDSMLDPEREYELLVRVLPDMPAPRAVRDSGTNRVKASKIRQTVQASRIRRADTPDSIRELFGMLLEHDAEGAGALLDMLQADVRAKFAVAA